MKDGIFKTIADKVKKNPKVLVIIGLCGILLIALSGFFQGTKSNNTQEPTSAAMSADNYKSQLEQQVKSAISHVTGGKVSVVITLDSDIEYVYACEGKSQSSEESNSKSDDNKLQKDVGSENNYVIVKDADGNETPLVVTAVMPNIKGAVVNCEGGEDPSLNAAIVKIVTTALNISDSKVYVTGYYE